MARTQEDTHIYGAVNSLEDLRRINREIRREMDEVTHQAQLTELKKRSDYLCTLAEAPSWQEKFGRAAPRLRAVGAEEFRRTAHKINRRAAHIGTEANFDEKWGD